MRGLERSCDICTEHNNNCINNAPELANQSMGYIGNKQEPYDK